VNGSQSHASASQGDLRGGLIAVSIAITAWGTTGVMIKAIDMDAIAIVGWRFGIYAIALTAWMYGRGGRLSTDLLRTALPGGALLAADVILFFVAVRTTKVVNATTIGALQPIIIAAFATRFMGEKIRPREIMAATIALVGVIVVITQSSGTPEWSGAGDLAAVGALFAWSMYFVVAKRTAGKLTPHEFTTGAAWWVTVLAFPFGLAIGQDMSPPPRSEVLPLLILVSVGGFIGHSMMNWGIPRLPLWLSSTLTLLVPVFASLAAWVYLGEALTVWQLLAMGLVIVSLAVVVVSQTRPVPVLPPQAPIDISA
jgi:drug/metabolite transporter (DMT)-like permease